jgi:hypothetical protein
MFRFEFYLSDNPRGPLLSPLTRNAGTKTNRAVTRFRSKLEIFAGQKSFALHHGLRNFAPCEGGVTSFLLRALRIFTTAWRSAMRIFGDALRCGAKGRRFFPIFGSWLSGRTVVLVDFVAANCRYTSCLSLPSESN